MTYVSKRFAKFGKIPPGGYVTVALIITSDEVKDDSGGKPVIPPGDVEKIFEGDELPAEIFDDRFKPEQYEDSELSMSILSDIAESTPFKRIFCTGYGHIDLYWPTAEYNLRVLYAVATAFIQGKTAESQFFTVTGNDNLYPHIDNAVRWGLEALGCWIKDLFDTTDPIPVVLEKHHIGGNYYIVAPEHLTTFVQ